MKKIIIYTFAFLFLATSSVLAANNNNNSNSNKDVAVSTTSGNQSGIQNQNKVTTQNQGEEQALQVSTQESEQNEGELSGSSSAIQRGKNLDQDFTKVSDQVHQLLETRISNTGIGQQVKEIAQNQQKAQEKIKSTYQKLNSKNKVLSFLFGPDFESIGSLTSQLSENQERIELLTQLKTQLTNKTEADQIQETIDLMIYQNTSLQEQLNLENKVPSLFGWLVKLFK